MHDAAIGDYEQMAELLLANQADVNSRDKAGSTPLHEAVSRGHKDVGELLRQHGGHESCAYFNP
jgi:ankyrin repeat protein